MSSLYSLTKEEKRSYLYLHLSVFLWGFTAILGELITINALALVWWRILFTCISILVLFRIKDDLKTIPSKLLWKMFGIGFLIMLHWVAFYGAIKISNASITLVCLSTTSFFTSFIEPLFNKTKIKDYEIFLGLLIIPGMVLVVNSVNETMYLGIFLGLLSALFAAIFSSINKSIVNEVQPISLTFVELLAGWIGVSLILFVGYCTDLVSFDHFMPVQNDFYYLVVLALLCTTLPFILSIKALRHLSAFASNLTINLEPVYGVILAWLILKENKELSPQFYWGGAVIMLAVFSYPLIKQKFERNQTTIA